MCLKMYYSKGVKHGVHFTFILGCSISVAICLMTLVAASKSALLYSIVRMSSISQRRWLLTKIHYTSKLYTIQSEDLNAYQKQYQVDVRCRTKACICHPTPPTPPTPPNSLPPPPSDSLTCSGRNMVDERKHQVKVISRDYTMYMSLCLSTPLVPSGHFY